MTVVGWCVAAYLLGALLLSVAETDWRTGELASLAVWPVMVPIGYVIRWRRRRRSTCRICGQRYADRAYLLAHVSRAHEEAT